MNGGIIYRKGCPSKGVCIGRLHWWDLLDGSFSTLLLLLNTIVWRSTGSNAGQCGNFGTFGFPVRANAIHASLTLSVSATAPGAPPVKSLFDINWSCQFP